MADDPLMPQRPWRGDFKSRRNQAGPGTGKPIILDKDGKLVATFERTVDRDCVLNAIDAEADTHVDQSEQNTLDRVIQAVRGALGLNQNLTKR